MDMGDPRCHGFGAFIELIKKELTPFSNEQKQLLMACNLGIFHHYHTLFKEKDPSNRYCQLLEECKQNTHGFTCGKQIEPWTDFEKAEQLFQGHFNQILKIVRDLAKAE